jgi:hypothetical protein
MNAETILEYLKNRVATVDQLVQQQRTTDARAACCEIIVEARLLQQQLRLEQGAKNA